MKTKICTRCHQRKSIKDFGKHSKEKDGLRGWCKICHRTANNNYYAGSYGRSYRYNVRQRNRNYVYNFLMASKCIDCGEDRWQVLEFDHVRGTKLYQVTSMFNCHSIKSIQKEIEKCDIRCANCHKLRTMKQLNFYKADWGRLSSKRMTKMPNKKTPQRGERHSQAVLTVKKVRRIRRLYKENDCTVSYLAKRYKVSEGCIYGVVTYRTWKEISY